MFSKLEEVEARFESLGLQLQDPSITSDTKKYAALMKDYSDLTVVVESYRRYKKAVSDLSSAKTILETEKDPELREMAKEEASYLEKVIPPMEQALKVLLLPKDPKDDKNVIVEIRAGAGGDEASLFAGELFDSYSRFASKQGWKVEPLNSSPGNMGGYKEVSAMISGEKVYSKMKFESGVHRVQRVPATETQGRVHTSTVTVAVLPEAEEVEVSLNPTDLRVETFRAGGAGGQHVNKTDSAVRMIHIPTGLVVVCQDERSQIKNRSKALKIMAARLQAQEEERVARETSQARSAQIGSGDRSEKIRTYNFPQSRVTDHRVGLTIHQLSSVMGGDMELILDPVISHFQAEALKAQSALGA